MFLGARLKRNGSIYAYVNIIYDDFRLSRGFDVPVYLVLGGGVVCKCTVLLMILKSLLFPPSLKKGGGLIQNKFKFHSCVVGLHMYALGRR
jgi:hypothetical protein